MTSQRHVCARNGDNYHDDMTMKMNSLPQIRLTLSRFTPHRISTSNQRGHCIAVVTLSHNSVTISGESVTTFSSSPLCSLHPLKPPTHRLLHVPTHVSSSDYAFVLLNTVTTYNCTSILTFVHVHKHVPVKGEVTHLPKN